MQYITRFGPTLSKLSRCSAIESLAAATVKAMKRFREQPPSTLELLTEQPIVQSHWRPVDAADLSLHRNLVELDGIEPTTPCLQSRCSPN